MNKFILISVIFMNIIIEFDAASLTAKKVIFNQHVSHSNENLNEKFLQVCVDIDIFDYKNLLIISILDLLLQ